MDDKSYEKCEGKSPKEQFAIKIDAIRKSLDIETMEDVHLLVDELFKFQENYDQQLEAEKEKILQRLAEKQEGAGEGEVQNSMNENKKQSNEATANGGNNTGQDVQAQEEEEHDPNAL